MSKNRHPDLAYWGNGIISIRNQDELDLLLACRAPIFDRESIQFVGLEWNDDEERLVAREEFVPGAAQQVVSAGILPEPTSQLPAIGARVETIEVGGKPSPACRYGVGTVTGSSWDCVFGVWRVEVTFDGCTGGWQGFPVYGTSTFVWMVHVIGSDERSFSDMTPGEIEALYQARRQQLHAPDRPATWLADSSDLADEAPDFVSERDKALAFFQGAPIHIWGQDELDCLLACPPSIAVRRTCRSPGGWMRKTGTSRDRGSPTPSRKWWPQGYCRPPRVGFRNSEAGSRRSVSPIDRSHAMDTPSARSGGSPGAKAPGRSKSPSIGPLR